MRKGIVVNKIYAGNTLDVLRTFPDECVDLCVTSPPYWNLRDYGEETYIVWGGDAGCKGGDADCKHDFSKRHCRPNDKSGIHGPNSIIGAAKAQDDVRFGPPSATCSKCGAWCGQLGLEPSIDLYLSHLWQITDELYRVLKPTGVMFWNHGDNYGGSCGREGKQDFYEDPSPSDVNQEKYPEVSASKGFMPKSLVFQNYRLILGMLDVDYRVLVEWRALGKPRGKLETMLEHPRIQRILRNAIVWRKLNHMPSSVKDRFTNGYEPVFMLTKNKKYWFDLDAVRVAHKYPDDVARKIRQDKEDGIAWCRDLKTKIPQDKAESFGNPRARNYRRPDKKRLHTFYGHSKRGEEFKNPAGKNPGDVWTIPTQPYKQAHFATFPEKLVQPMILSSCPQWICKKCGKARVRISESSFVKTANSKPTQIGDGRRNPAERTDFPPNRGYTKHKTIDWTDCHCNAGWDSGVVLDPFMGSGTVGAVAKKLGRNYIGIELNPNYIKMAEQRLRNITPAML